jgi:hypothetical protein
MRGFNGGDAKVPDVAGRRCGGASRRIERGHGRTWYSTRGIQRISVLFCTAAGPFCIWAVVFWAAQNLLFGPSPLTLYITKTSLSSKIIYSSYTSRREHTRCAKKNEEEEENIPNVSRCHNRVHSRKCGKSVSVVHGRQVRRLLEGSF